MNPIELNDDQWNAIKSGYRNTSYGENYQFFDSPEDIVKAPKVITLNGSPLRTTGGRIQSSIEERLGKGNMVVKVPSGKMSGKYAIVSKTLMTKAGLILQTAQSRLSANDL